MQFRFGVFAMNLLLEARNFLEAAKLRDDGLDGDTSLAISRQHSSEHHYIYRRHLTECEWEN